MVEGNDNDMGMDEYLQRVEERKRRIVDASSAAQNKAYGQKRTRRRRSPSERLACGCWPESFEQRVFVREARLRGYTPFWTRGERDESLASRSWAGQMGMIRGMPDILILDLPGYAIELKARCKRHRLSDVQVQTIEHMRDRGWIVDVCHGSDEAIAALDNASSMWQQKKTVLANQKN